MKFAMLMMAVCVSLNACLLQPVKNESLFTRIGGKDMLAKISSETLDVISTDARTKHSFEDVKMKALKESFTNFLCIKTGGDCVYEGDTMKKSHADAKITTAEFELTVQVLRDTLDANHIGTREKNELLKILAPMKRDVVTQ